MKNKEAVIVNGFISKLKLSKFGKDVRIALLKDYTSLSPIVKSFEENIDTLRSKMFEDYQEDMQKVQELRDKAKAAKSQEEIDKLNKEAEKYSDYFKTEQEFVHLYEEESNKEVSCDIVKIDKESFIDSVIESGEEITIKDIENLSILFK